jgi:hypothetical protein
MGMGRARPRPAGAIGGRPIIARSRCTAAPFMAPDLRGGRRLTAACLARGAGWAQRRRNRAAGDCRIRLGGGGGDGVRGHIPATRKRHGTAGPGDVHRRPDHARQRWHPAAMVELVWRRGHARPRARRRAARARRARHATPAAVLRSTDVPIPPGWDRRPCAYLLLSEPYAPSAADAGARGWPLCEIADGKHLDPVRRPAAVATALLNLERAMLGPSS